MIEGYTLDIEDRFYHNFSKGSITSSPKPIEGVEGLHSLSYKIFDTDKTMHKEGIQVLDIESFGTLEHHKEIFVLADDGFLKFPTETYLLCQSGGSNQVGGIGNSCSYTMSFLEPNDELLALYDAAVEVAYCVVNRKSSQNVVCSQLKERKLKNALISAYVAAAEHI